MRAPIEWMCSDDQRSQIEPYLSEALFLVPDWLQTLTVRYDPNEENVASIGVLAEYRSANLRIGDAWFSESPAQQRVFIIHEVLHLHIETLSVVYDALLKATTEEETPLRKWAQEQWRRAEEGCISDLSRVVKT